MKKATDYELHIATEKENKKEMKRMRDIGKRSKETERRRNRVERDNFKWLFEETETLCDREEN